MIHSFFPKFFIGRRSCRIAAAMAVMLIGGMVFLDSATAQAESMQGETLLVINAYHEDELWSNSMTQPIKVMLHNYPQIHSESFYLNNSAIRNMEEYETMCSNLFERYADHHPSYVVLIGNMAFTLRDRIKEAWGEDVPMLLIARSGMGGPVEEYMTGPGQMKEADSAEQFYFSSLRKNYNFSAVIVPDFAEETVDLMVSLIPDMKEFVFVSDKAYANRVAARDIRLHLSSKYADIPFRWIQASDETREEFRDLLSIRKPDTGILVSSWVYEIENSRNMKILTTRELSYIWGSLNPVFSLRNIYMNMGCIGGTFVDTDEIKDNIVSRVKAMIDGRSMRNEPFYIADVHRPMINYNLLTSYGLSPSNCPEGTIFTERPMSFWEKYRFATILAILLLIVVIVIIGIYNSSYRKQIAMLKEHEIFLNNMPLPYTRVIMWLVDDQVTNMTYEQKNVAYEAVIEHNGLPTNPLHLFTDEFLNNLRNQMISSGKAMEFNYHFKHSDSYYHFVCIPVGERRKNHGSRAYEMDVFAIDLTKDYKMERRIKDQSVTIDIAMEMAHLVPWQWNAADRKVSFFPYKNADFGSVDKDSTRSVSFEDYLNTLHDEDRKLLADSYASLASGKSTHFDVQYRVRDPRNPGAYFWFENHGAITDTDSEGNPLRITGSVQNITGNKQQEEKMAAALAKANESDRLKSAFLANMSHEIRTPLNAIVGFSNLLAESDNPAERQEFAQIINSNNDLLLTLINDILDLAKIESNTITITKDVCDIHDLVDSVSKTISIRVPENVRLNVVHYSDECIVTADASHVTQVLINLLTNATKFTRKGSITVGYEVREDDGVIYMYVKDTGQGLSKEQIETVFERFVKFNSFVQGSGLGLAICRTLVNRMGGEIGVESAGVGRGCTFWFTIPYEPNTEPIENLNIRKADGLAASFDSHTTFGVAKTATRLDSSWDEIPSGLVILVVEDNPSNFWLMSRLIHGKCTVHHAENGKIGVEMFQELHPDLIVMDINMPVMDGYEAVAEIRKIDDKVPIIAATAYAFPSDRMRILNSGFNAYVSKPVSAASLYDAIISVLDSKGGGDSGSKCVKVLS